MRKKPAMYGETTITTDFVQSEVDREINGFSVLLNFSYSLQKGKKIKETEKELLMEKVERKK